MNSSKKILGGLFMALATCSAFAQLEDGGPPSMPPPVDPPKMPNFNFGRWGVPTEIRLVGELGVHPTVYWKLDAVVPNRRRD